MGYRLTEKGEKAKDILYLKGDKRSPVEGRVFAILRAISRGRLLHLAVVSLRIGDSLEKMGLTHQSCEDILEGLTREGLVEEV